MNEATRLELVGHEGQGWYWMLDSFDCGWLVSKTYKTKQSAAKAMAKNKVVWEEENLK